MSRTVEIKVFPIAQTRVNPKAVHEWLTHLGAQKYAENELGIWEDGAQRNDLTTDPALLIALAAKRCYMSFEVGLNPNVTKVRKDITEYLDNVLKSKHGSVCEHAVYSFAIEGVSRVFTGEMNRHRAGVGISEGSMRYIRYRDIPYWLPTSITLTEEEEAAFLKVGGNIQLATKKLESQKVFERAFKQMEENYAELEKIWADELAPTSAFAGKKHVTSMMRRIIGMGVATGGVWTMNIRALRHIIALRASEAAEEEILYVFSRVAKYMVENEPMLLGDFVETLGGFWTPKYAKI